MQSSLKKSLYLGLAALSFASVAAVSTNASAKSYAKAGAETDLTVSNKDTNVESTGTNALFTKPGTTKGAKVVASKAKMKKMANSGKSADYFWAYRTTTTNKGAVYYKVVSMNGKYRGYVYAGKKEGAFSRGLVKADTMTKATMPEKTTMYFKTPGTHNVTWNAPKYTEHKASKKVIDTTPFAADELTVTDAKTKTREGTLYYKVTDKANPTVSGWIYSGALTTEKTASFNQNTDVKVNLVSATDNSVVKTTVLQNLLKNTADNTAADTVAATDKGQSVGYNALAQATTNAASWNSDLLKGTGYTFSATASNNVSALQAAKTGDTINLSVTKGDQITQGISAYTQDGVTVTPLTVATSDTPTVTAATTLVYQIKAPKLSAAFAGANDVAYTASDVFNFLNNNGGTTLSSVDYAKKLDGTIVAVNDEDAIGVDGKTVASDSNKVQTYHKEYTLTSGVAGTFAANGKAKAFYNTVKEVKGTATVDNSGNNSVFE